MNKIVGILLVLISASASAGNLDEDLLKLVKAAGTVEQARTLIRECRDRAFVHSENLKSVAEGKSDFAKYVRLVVETTCESEVLNNGKK